MTNDSLPQLDQMRMGVEYRQLVRIRNFSVSLRPLTISEQIHVASDVAEEFAQMPEKMKHQLSEHTVLAKRTLIRASTPSPEVNSPLLTDLLIEKMTADEVLALFKEYNAICDKCNPMLDKMLSEDALALVDVLKKNPSRLTELSFWQLKEAVLCLIAQNG